MTILVINNNIEERERERESERGFLFFFIMYSKPPQGGTPTPYDLLQDRGTVSIGFAISVMIAIVFAMGLVWLIILTFDLVLLSSRIVDSEDTCQVFNESLIELKEDLLPDFQLLSEKGEADGYAPLGPDSIVPDEHLPPDIFDAALFRGCWDAATNFPLLVSSVGLNGEFFIVCIPGATVLDGEGEWNFHDMLIFEGDTGVWRRVDGGRNTIVDAVAPPSGGEVSIVGDGLGPFFSLLKLEGSEFVNFTTDGETNLLQFFPPPPPPPPPPCIGPNVTSLEDSGPDATLILDGIGPDMVIRQIAGQPQLCGECSGVNVATNPTNLRLSLATFYRFGTWDGIFTTALTETPVSRGDAVSFVRQRGRYMRVGNDAHGWVKWSICFLGKVPNVDLTRFTFSGSILSVFDNMALPTSQVVFHTTLNIGSLFKNTFFCGPEINSVNQPVHGSGIMEALTTSPRILIDLHLPVPNIANVNIRYEMHMFASWRTTGVP